MIDLHTHSTASDGTLSPSRLVQLAAKSKLDAVALTDHDTLSGLQEALDAGRECNIEVIPGCELSVGAGSQSMHLVGLWTAPGSPALTRSFEFVLKARAERNVKIVAKLKKLGIDISLEEVAAKAGGTVGRPHIAQVLVEKGAVPTLGQAFSEFVGNHGSAYVPRIRLSPQEALTALKEDGATSILAHPALLGLKYHQLKETLVELKALGLDGLEVYYTDHSPRTMDLLL
ncbi:MAG: PHP domain-containing protein, partial [Proteobacteria bacterium]|nr:PHP domain-containing protein [Pseudomonadota bacterium]